jgi:hypothetical protein
MTLAGISPGGHVDDHSERILADLTERTMAAILHPQADIATTLGLIAKAGSFLRVLADVYRQRSDAQLDTLLEHWNQELIEAPK